MTREERIQGLKDEYENVKADIAYWKAKIRISEQAILFAEKHQELIKQKLENLYKVNID